MLRHNKKKNSYIIFEQLLTLAARLVSSKKVNEFEYVMGLTRKHFDPNTALGKEKKIIQSIVEASCKSESEADDLITEALKEVNSIDQNKLEQEKITLINEINKNLGMEFFKIPVKNYKLYASAQILMNESKSGYVYTTPEERVKIKKILKENLVKQEEREEIPEIDNLTYKILVNKFNKKYGPFINEDQKAILSAWIKYLITEDKSVIEPVLQEKIDRIKKVVHSSLKNKTHKATDYYELLKEACESLETKKISEINEEVVYEVMRYFDLVEDLEKNS